MATDYRPPDNGRPNIESVCENGHHVFRELDWRQPMIFRKDVSLGTRCPICSAELMVKSGTYQLGTNGKYLRVGPP
jgi:hypothetical protein